MKLDSIEWRKQWRAKNRNIINEKQRSMRKNRHLRLYRSAKQRAKKLDLDFNIDKEDVIIPTHCPVLDVDFDETRMGGPSIDRINSQQGYIKGNIQVISSKANTMKSNATVEELRSFARWVKETYGFPEEEFQ